MDFQAELTQCQLPSATVEPGVLSVANNTEIVLLTLKSIIVLLIPYINL